MCHSRPLRCAAKQDDAGLRCYLKRNAPHIYSAAKKHALQRARAHERTQTCTCPRARTNTCAYTQTDISRGARCSPTLVISVATSALCCAVLAEFLSAATAHDAHCYSRRACKEVLSTAGPAALPAARGGARRMLRVWAGCAFLRWPSVRGALCLRRVRRRVQSLAALMNPYEVFWSTDVTSLV